MTSWIKLEHTTPDKPEVVRLAAMLGVDQDAVVGKLVRLWIWADQQSVAGDGMSVTFSFLDRLVFCPGFAAGLVEIGWLSGRDGLLSIPNFDRHNGQTAKNRANMNRRVAAFRKRGHADVTPRALQLPLPEEEEEKELRDVSVLGRVALPLVSAAEAEPFPADHQEVMDFAASLPLTERPRSAFALERSCLAFADWLADPANRRRAPDWRRKLISWLKQDALREAEREVNWTPKPREKSADDYRLMPRKQS